MTADLLPAYEAWLRASGASERTVTARVMGVRHVTRRAGLDAPTQLAAVHVIEWVGAQRNAWTRVTYYSHAASWARFLTTMEAGGEWIGKVPKPRAKPGTPRPVTDDELHHALAVASPRARTMILLGAYEGLRESEIGAVRGEHVTESTLYVEGKGGTRKMLPTHPLVWAEAASHPRSGYWFGAGGTRAHVPDPSRPLSRISVWRTIKDAFDAAGVEGGPHRLRHWYATSLLRSGANIRVVQECMRHASLATTQVYTKVDQEECRAAVAALPTLALIPEVEARWA